MLKSRFFWNHYQMHIPERSNGFAGKHVLKWLHSYIQQKKFHRKQKATVSAHHLLSTYLVLDCELFCDAIPLIDLLVSSVKTLLSETPSRRAGYIRHLKTMSVRNPKLSAASVLNRWDAWFSMVFRRILIISFHLFSQRRSD